MDILDDITQKKFRKRLMGFDSEQVEAFFQVISEEIRRLKGENEGLKRSLQTQELEIREHKDREATIRSVLVTAQKNAEQIKINAEREAKLTVSEAEVKAEKILREANERLMKMDQEISELKRHRVQFGAKMRNLLDSFRQILDEDSKETLRKFEENQPQKRKPTVESIDDDQQRIAGNSGVPEM
jgi:cell division initiation protein